MSWRRTRAHVVGLGARCELEAASGRHASFRVSEFAVLDDGRRLTLHDERGFESWAANGGELQLTVANREAAVRTTVLPDDDEPDDDHPWEWLVQLLAARGVESSTDALRAVPYTVELGDRLQALLDDRPQGWRS